MVRRFVPGALVALAVGLLTLAGLPASAGDKPAGKKGGAHHAMHADPCAKACADCMRACESCAHHCAHLVAEGKKDHLKSMGTCIDCSDFCVTAARVVARHGPLAVPACEACAKACDACAGECDRCCEKSPDEHMKACATACRDCAKACRTMVQHAGHERPAASVEPKR